MTKVNINSTEPMDKTLGIQDRQDMVNTEYMDHDESKNVKIRASVEGLSSERERTQSIVTKKGTV